MSGLSTYMATSAVWVTLIGIGVCLLVILGLIALLYMIHHHRRQDAALSLIGEQLEGIAHDPTLAFRMAEQTAGPSYEEAMEQFFAETELEAAELSVEYVAEATATTPVASFVAPEAVSAVPDSAPATTSISRTEEQSPAAPAAVESTPSFDFAAFRAALEGEEEERDRLYDTARSGRRYSRAELENQIKG